MICYSVEIPNDVKISGVTANGDPTLVLPGEYLVHQLQPKVPSAKPLLRLVGADAMGRDAHVPLESIRTFLGERQSSIQAAFQLPAAKL
jgi:hypothetical protein